MERILQYIMHNCNDYRFSKYQYLIFCITLRILMRMDTESSNHSLERERINQLFETSDSTDITLYMSHLTRPWNLPIILLDKSLRPSSDLPPSVRRQRTYYDKWPTHGDNDDVSFSVGLPQLSYTKEHDVSDKFEGGIGFVLPWSIYKDTPELSIVFGNFPVRNALSMVTGTDKMEDQFLRITAMTDEQIEALKLCPKTPEDFELALHLCRKAGLLTGGDQGEVVLRPNSPGLALDQIQLLLPQVRQPELLRYLDIRLSQIAKDVQLPEAVRQKASEKTAQSLLSQIPQIYWYHHETITDAIKWLSIKK